MLEIILGISIIHIVLFLNYLRKQNKPDWVYGYVSLCLRDEQDPNNKQFIMRRFRSFRFFPRVGDTLSFELEPFELEYLEVTEVVHEEDKTITIWCDKKLSSEEIELFIEDNRENGIWKDMLGDPKYREVMKRRIPRRRLRHTNDV